MVVIQQLKKMGTVKPPVSPSMTKIITNLKKLLTKKTAKPLIIQQNTNITKMVVIPRLTNMGTVNSPLSANMTKIKNY